MHTNWCVLIEISMEIGMLNLVKSFEWDYWSLHWTKNLTLVPGFLNMQYMGENRYVPFKDEKKGSTWVRRGKNHSKIKRRAVHGWERISKSTLRSLLQNLVVLGFYNLKKKQLYWLFNRDFFQIYRPGHLIQTKNWLWQPWK